MSQIITSLPLSKIFNFFISFVNVAKGENTGEAIAEKIPVVKSLPIENVIKLFLEELNKKPFSDYRITNEKEPHSDAKEAYQLVEKPYSKETGQWPESCLVETIDNYTRRMTIKFSDEYHLTITQPYWLDKPQGIWSLEFKGKPVSINWGGK